MSSCLNQTGNSRITAASQANSTKTFEGHSPQSAFGSGVTTDFHPRKSLEVRSRYYVYDKPFYQEMLTLGVIYLKKSCLSYIGVCLAFADFSINVSLHSDGKLFVYINNKLWLVIKKVLFQKKVFS